jgi:hypothetical protein
MAHSSAWDKGWGLSVGHHHLIAGLVSHRGLQQALAVIFDLFLSQLHTHFPQSHVA